MQYYTDLRLTSTQLGDTTPCSTARRNMSSAFTPTDNMSSCPDEECQLTIRQLMAEKDRLIMEKDEIVNSKDRL